jgi:hypothetical protein
MLILIVVVDVQEDSAGGGVGGPKDGLWRPAKGSAHESYKI